MAIGTAVVGITEDDHAGSVHLGHLCAALSKRTGSFMDIAEDDCACAALLGAQVMKLSTHAGRTVEITADDHAFTEHLRLLGAALSRRTGGFMDIAESDYAVYACAELVGAQDATLLIRAGRFADITEDDHACAWRLELLGVDLSRLTGRFTGTADSQGSFVDIIFGDSGYEACLAAIWNALMHAIHGNSSSATLVESEPAAAPPATDARGYDALRRLWRDLRHGGVAIGEIWHRTGNGLLFAGLPVVAVARICAFARGSCSGRRGEDLPRWAQEECTEGRPLLYGCVRRFMVGVRTASYLQYTIIATRCRSGVAAHGRCPSHGVEVKDPNATLTATPERCHARGGASDTEGRRRVVHSSTDHAAGDHSHIPVPDSDSDAEDRASSVSAQVLGMAVVAACLEGCSSRQTAITASEPMLCSRFFDSSQCSGT